MTSIRIRSWLYPLAKYLGDLQALTSKREGAISRRIGRRIAGKITGSALGKMFG